MAKHTLAFCSRWSQKEIKNTFKLKNMKHEEKKKKSAGRPAKNVKKEINASVRFSRSEYFIVKEKAATCGFSVSNYMRKASIYSTITPRTTAEEQLWVRQLVGMSNNMNQMAKACYQEGLFESMRFFETYRQQLIEIIKKLKS
jgi:predicted DNA binding CopG/RHH family protein